MQPSNRLQRVLVIDDDVCFANLVATHLDRTRRYDARCAHDQKEALAVAREWTPDVVLLDFILGDRIGSDVFFVMRRDPNLRRVPIVMMSCLNELFDDEKHSPLGSGLIRHLPRVNKPFSGKKLERALEDAFDNCAATV